MVKGEAEKAEIDMLLEELNASRADEGPDRWHWRPGPSFVAHTIHPSLRRLGERRNGSCQRCQGASREPSRAGYCSS